MNISQHTYVNPMSLEDKLYDKSEVLLMLRQLGHLEIPLGARMRAPAAELGRKKSDPQCGFQKCTKPYCRFERQGSG